jgi:hypothetical protein
MAAADAPAALFLGQVVVPKTTQFDGTVIGGLSAISYDPQRDVYYVICDDKSQYSSARFYTVRLSVSARGVGDVTFVASHPWMDVTGQPFAATDINAEPPTLAPDPEGIAFDSSRQRLYWSSEGAKEFDPADGSTRVLNPWIRIADLDGGYQGEFSMPTGFQMSATKDSGPRFNQSLEGVTLAPDGQFLFTAMEDPRYEDGPVPTHDRGALTRFIKFDVGTRRPVAQYAYPIDPAGAPDTNGLSDVVALSDTSFLVLERGGPPATVRLYRADIGRATDVTDLPSLTAQPVIPMNKTLVADLTTTPGLTPLDNIEGLTLGPVLPDGRQSLLLISDDNYSPTEVTQFVAFAM